MLLNRIKLCLIPTLISVRIDLVLSDLIEIEDPYFVHRYELGLFWAMYGDYYGNRRYEDSYLFENISRNSQTGCYDCPDSSWFTSAGFYFSMLYGGLLAKPSDTLVVLIEQDFTEGYQHGCQYPN